MKPRTDNGFAERKERQMGEMTRQQFIDLLQGELDKSFPGEQSGFQVSPDDIDAVQEALVKVCCDALSEIGGGKE